MGKLQANYSRGYTIAFAATVLWSSTGVLISYLSRVYQLPVLVMAFWRDLMVALGMAAGLVVISRGRFHLPRSQWKFMLLNGLTLAVFNILWIFSIEFNGAAVATVLAFSSPAITAILSRWIFREEFSRTQVISIVLSLSGTILVSGALDPNAWNLNPGGILFGLLTGLIFAIYNLEGKHAADQKIDSWTALLYSFATAAALLLIFKMGIDLLTSKPLFTDMLWLGDSIGGWGVLLFLAMGPTLGGFGLYTLSMRYLSPTVTNLISTFEPVLTSIWAFLLFGEVMGRTQLMGSLVLFAGIILLRAGKKGRGDPEPVAL
jgi:drug/metabolite transporter (DMT)-like permease